jgi:Fe-S oxidoreductase
LGQPVQLSDRCCGEAGTFAISRPDIATQVRYRKQEELLAGVGSTETGERVKVLTSCPACLQGLSRYRDQIPVEADYIVTELAGRVLGEDWQSRFLQAVARGGIERVLL